MKHLVASMSFFFVWIGVALICGLIMVLIFPPQGSPLVKVGISTDLASNWRNAPGTILGLLAGIHSGRVSIRKADENAARKKTKLAGSPA